MNVSCGTCQHFQKRQPYTWGTCSAPLPYFVTFEINLILFPLTNIECDCYKEKEQRSTV